ncbi:MAG: phytanoyl-CoA dioxygenase family protein [Planctomycetota bacterium]|nr:phytanoyl-CoA dioxygenase family protein [Planctomycetota bacterium]
MQAAAAANKSVQPDWLAELDRELRFHPITNRAPKTLSLEQVEAFNRDGCLAPLDVFNASEIAVHRAYFDGLLERVRAEGKDSYSINGWHAKCPGIWDLVTEPRIVAIARDLLGEDVVCWGTHYFCKLPRDGKAVSWHQDAEYWPFSQSRTVTVWLALDDADPGNGCMQVLPGSHLHGELEHGRSGEDERNVLWLTAQGVERFGAPRDVALKAGQISIHSDLTLHSSPPNPSERRRCGLTLRYVPAEVVPYRGWGANAIRVSGEDRKGLWGNRPRPAEL